MSWSHLIIIVRITWSLATIYLKPKYAAWPQAISSNSLGHGRLPKTISTQALFLDFGLLGVCHMAACHNPSQTIVCCLAACRNPSAPRVCRMAACHNPSAPRVCHMAACRFPSPKLEGGTLLCRLDACHFPSYQTNCKTVKKSAGTSRVPFRSGRVSASLASPLEHFELSGCHPSIFKGFVKFVGQQCFHSKI